LPFLSTRNKEIIRLLWAGHSRQVIATQLGISGRSVYNAIRESCQIVQAANVPELMKYALDHNIIQVRGTLVKKDQGA
jgi:DNA-binding CsgD family transcriptional regulator